MFASCSHDLALVWSKALDNGRDAITLRSSAVAWGRRMSKRIKTMTKADRADFDRLMEALAKKDYFREMAIRQCIEYGLTSKSKELVKLRELEKEGII